VFTARYVMNMNLVSLHVTLQEEYTEMGEFMSKGQADGWLRPVIGQQYSLEGAADAHVEVLEHRTSTRGKIVLNI